MIAFWRWVFSSGDLGVVKVVALLVLVEIKNLGFGWVNFWDLWCYCSVRAEGSVDGVYGIVKVICS